MKRFSQLALAIGVFALMGQGCFQFGGGGDAAVSGGVWQTADGGRTWNQLDALPQVSGVGSIGGVNVTAIEIDPNDDTAYYIGTRDNGMFYSLDNGSTWQRPEDSVVRDGGILDVEVDPRDVCTIYALKSDRVLKSTDCARSFSSVFVESREGEELTAFVLDWFNPDTLWMGTSNGEVLRTQDAGASWATVERFRSEINSVVLSNADSRVVLAGTERQGLYLRNPEDGTFISYEDTLREFRESDEVFGFAQTANGSKIVMNTQYGLLASSDRGTTWEPIPLITPPGDVRIWSVAVHPTNGDVMYYATDTTFYVSTSGGASWETFDSPSTRAATAMEVHPANTNVVIAGFSSID